MTEPTVRIDLGVEGMTCDRCVVRVIVALQSVPGVEAASADLGTHSAVVAARPDVSADALARVVLAAGEPAGHHFVAVELRRELASSGGRTASSASAG